MTTPLTVREFRRRFHSWLRKHHLWIKRTKPKPKPKPPVPAMYDDVNINLIPVNAKAVAGYVDGKWPTYAQLVKKFPHAPYKLSIAVFPQDNAHALDVEPGDATIADAPAWIRRQYAHGDSCPILYTSASWGQALIDACTKAGLVYGKDYLWWSAHYMVPARPHLCGPKCGFGLKQTAHATQWTNQSGGKSLDESVCTAEFFKSFESAPK